MSWLYERFEKTSEKNGRITVERFFGRWEIRVGGYAQSGPYADRLFKNALRKMPKGTKIRSALVLGLGGGCLVELLHRRFSGVEVTVVEWDPAMVEIAHRIRLFKPEHAPKIIVGDAREILPALSETYDLIVCDLFKGEDLAPILFLAPFFSALRRVSHPKTLLLVNAFRSQKLLDLAGETFVILKRWRFAYNVLGWFRASELP